MGHLDPQNRITAHLHSFVHLFSPPVEPTFTSSSISCLPSGLQDSCSPLSQIIPSPKPYFLPPLPPPPKLTSFQVSSFSFLRVCFSSNIVHPTRLPQTSFLPTPIICPSLHLFCPSFLLLVWPLSLSLSFYCSFCSAASWSVLCSRSSKSIDFVYKQNIRFYEIFSLCLYGIQGQLHTWLTDFLHSCSQRVELNKISFISPC